MDHIAGRQACIEANGKQRPLNETDTSGGLSNWLVNTAFQTCSFSNIVTTLTCSAPIENLIFVVISGTIYSTLRKTFNDFA